MFLACIYDRAFILDVVHALDKNDETPITMFWSFGPVNQLIYM